MNKGKKKAVNRKTSKKKTGKQKKKNPKIAFIVNPAAGGGRAKKRWPQIENYLLKNWEDFEVLFTKKRGEAITLAFDKLKQGVESIVAVGGDGTISEVVQGFDLFSSKTRKKPKSVLGILALGSGCDFIKSTGIPANPLKALKIIEAREIKKVDMGRVECFDESGKKVTKAFINIADIGIAGLVIDTLEKMGKSRFPTLSYSLASLKTLFRFQPIDMRIQVDNKRVFEGKYTMVVTANGKYFGSGMKVAPAAKVDDGLLDIIFVSAAPKWKLLFKFAKIHSGKHLNEPEVEMLRAKRIQVETKQPAYLDSDGEKIGKAPATFQIKPKFLSVYAPKNP